jgi:hypothetical protein
MREFKKGNNTKEKHEQSMIIMVDDAGVESCVPVDITNRDYMQYMMWLKEGYEPWDSDEEVDWEQSWEKVKSMPVAEETNAEPAPTKSKRRKKPSATPPDAVEG